jgi:hypothetical protein
MATTKVQSDSANPAPSAPAPVSGKPPFPNVLHSYALYNYVFTLCVLSADEINDDSYRNTSLTNKKIILRSANGSPDNRVPTSYPTAINPSGKYDFMLDDLTLNSSAGFSSAGGNTNATEISFKVTEPYSMGMFFQVLQIAALQNGNTNYTDVPLMLMIEFYGHKTPDDQNIKIPNTTKYIPMRIQSLDMKVSAAGAIYQIVGYPWAEKAFSNIHAELKTDVAIVGKTVNELLMGGAGPNSEKCLQAILNSRGLEEMKRSEDAKPPDLIFFTFPESSAEAGGLNIIGQSDMGFDTKRTGMQPFGQEVNIYDAATGTFKRSKSIIDPQLSEFKFAQGSDITNVINQVILMSEYGRKALDTVDENGMVNWWRIETRTYQNGTEVNSSGTVPKLIFYRILPYKVHVSKLSAPGTSLKGKKQLATQALKHYNYIYTGKNVDVLDFDLTFKSGFYTAINADRGLHSGDTVRGAQSSTAVGTAPASDKLPINDADLSKVKNPNSVQAVGTKSALANRGSGGLDDFKSIAAKQFHDAITAQADLLELDLTIIGDPYYLSDSGTGNYSARPTEYLNMNADGAMDYQSGEVDIIINFRVPVDNGAPNGLYEFPKGTGLLESFSGLFQVLKLESNFSRGQFKQTLNLVRRRNQESTNREGGPIPTEANINQNYSKR